MGAMGARSWVAGAVIGCWAWSLAVAAEVPSGSQPAATGAAVETSPLGPGNPLTQMVEWAKKRLEELEASLPETDSKLSDIRRQREAKQEEIRKVISGVDLTRDQAYVRLSRVLVDLQQQEQAVVAKRKQLGKGMDDDTRRGLQMKARELQRQIEETTHAKEEREWAYAEQARPALKGLKQQLEEIDAQARALREPREADQRKADQYIKDYTPRQVEAVEANKELTLVVPAVADASARRQRFNERNTPAAIAALAERFKGYLDLSAPGMLSIRTLAEQKKHLDFLMEYRKYFIAKLRDPSMNGVPGETIPLAMMVHRELPQAWIDDAMQGIFREVRGEQMLRVEVGMPGSMQWCHASDEYIGPKLENWLVEFYRAFGRPGMPGGLGVSTLMDAYIAKGDPAYLRQWCAAMDDWCLNWRDDLERYPDNIRSYEVQASRDLTHLLAQLRTALRTYDPSTRDFSPTTLARVLMLAVEEYNTAVIRAKRSMINGGTVRGMEYVVRNCAFLNEFRPSQWALGEVKRLAEREYVLTMSPDGGPRDFSDAGQPGPWAETYATIFSLLRHSRGNWLTEAWEREFFDLYHRNQRFFVRNLKPDGHRIQVDYRTLANVVQSDETDPPTFSSISTQSPELLKEPEVARVVGTVFGDGSGGAPQHLDDSLPYHASFHQRRSWDANDLYLCLRAPRLNGHPDEDVCGMKLFGFGQLMLNAPPIYVDGVSQNSHYGLVENPGGPASFLVFDDGRVGKGLWYSSQLFGLAEGIYEGAYEETGNRPYWSPLVGNGGEIPVQHVGEGAIRNVSRHSRQVFFLRQQGLWIVVDRMQSSAPHIYQQHYQLYTPMRKIDWFLRKLFPIAKLSPRVTLNQEQGLIAAQSPGLPSTTICQVASGPLHYEFRKGVPNTEFAKLTADDIRAADAEWRTARRPMSGMMAFNRQVTVSCKSPGPMVLISVIQARENGSTGEIKVLRRITGQDGPIGVRFDCPDGSRVTFQTATAKTQELRSGTISAVGESLLTVTTAKSGTTRGMATGCTSLTADGRPLKLRAPDFEFLVGGDSQGPTFASNPGYRPIQPVAILPEATVFVDKMQLELACATLGVEIHYTLDGTEPKATSPVYTGPVTLTERCQVRAIAIRPELKEIPWVIDGTRCTLPTWAYFTRQSPSEGSRKVSRESLAPGLAYEYFLGSPFEMFSAMHLMEPLRKGSVKRLFDVSMRQTGREFGVRYRGYVNLPSSGVYTFYAPREFWFPAQDAGYDLRVAIDGDAWYPSTRRHAFGSWSKALGAGLHAFECTFIDTRRKDRKVEAARDFPSPDAQWKGIAPELLVAGPGFKKQTIPDTWLLHEPQPEWVDQRLEKISATVRSDIDLRAGLVAFWDFQKVQDGKVLDASSHGFDARLIGGSVVDGPRGKAIRFTKADAGLIVEKPSRLLDGDADFTLVCHANVSDDSNGFLFQKSRRWRQDGWGWSAQGRFQAYRASAAADVAMERPVDSEPWRCLVLLYRAQDHSVRIYNQGKLAGYSVIVRTLPTTNDAPWKIAANINAEIDSLWVYSRALSREEILRITEGVTAKSRSSR
jgi:hypothetical protein